MDHNLFLFLIFYGISMIPYIATATYPMNKEIELGLLLIDMAVTIVAFYFLILAIGWWFIVVLLILEGMGMIYRGIGARPYSTLKKKKYVQEV